ncbi:hypothetical protein Nepgr_020803 [Nepenthes gracilis]|uniref:Uncharacterized protein n=1 Tax=Nepenthes gracilis TaxID=150966 RepID=A0AAD3SYN0_NEPGR|nr:hypothetical protein Nepgr_020803 [Nepenthes gracilis]
MISESLKCASDGPFDIITMCHGASLEVDDTMEAPASILFAEDGGSSRWLEGSRFSDPSSQNPEPCFFIQCNANDPSETSPQKWAANGELRHLAKA